MYAIHTFEEYDVWMGMNGDRRTRLDGQNWTNGTEQMDVDKHQTKL
jgi:hypothetical protein